MTKLQIVGCSDPSMWYQPLIGDVVPLRFIDNDGYWAIQPGGYLNVVRLEDGEVVEDGLSPSL